MAQPTLRRTNSYAAALAIPVTSAFPSLMKIGNDKGEKIMNPARAAVLGIGLALSTAAAAADLDGSKPLLCTGLAGHDCHPGKAHCSVLKPQLKTTPELQIDVAGKTIKTPYRTERLPIQNTVVNDEQLELQGTSLKFAWSAVVNRGTGKMTVTIADRQGAYVIFGQCKVADGT